MQSTTHGSSMKGGSAPFNSDHLGEQTLLDGRVRKEEVGRKRAEKGAEKTEREEEQKEEEERVNGLKCIC